MRRVADHLDILELERRFRTCPDPVEARHVQVIWLLAQGHTIGATSKVTAFGTRWVEQLLERYNVPLRRGPPCEGVLVRAKPTLWTAIRTVPCRSAWTSSNSAAVAVGR